MVPRGSGTRPQVFMVSDLLEWIDQRQLALPEFQREYDWDNERVLALVATVIRGWPAGSLLLQELSGATFFRLRPFDEGPPLDETRADLVVLDGQQRLTALYHAVYDVGSSVYAIRASAIVHGAGIDQLEDAMRSFDREHWDTDHREASFGPEDDWVPLYALRSAADYFAWRDDASRRSSDPERAALLISDAYRNGLERFQTYGLPSVIVESRLEPAAIARIFERVNRQGLPLKTFDLMVARTFVPDWNLRDRWADARLAHPQLDLFFGDDGMPVIRSIALATLGNVREQAVLTLEPTIVRLQWDDAVDAMARAVTFLETSCGVSDPDWVPYAGMLITLAALERQERLSEHEDLMVRWFLSRGLGLRYETAANTVTVEEFHHLQEVLRGEQVLRDISVAERVLRDATRRRQAAVWRTFLCCLSMAGAPRVGLGESLEPAMTPTPVLERLPAPRGVEPAHQLVLNLVLADRRTARRISGKGIPSLVDALSGLSPATRDFVSQAQFLPPALNAAMTTAEFIAGRIDRLDEWLRARLGHPIERAQEPGPKVETTAE